MDIKNFKPKKLRISFEEKSELFEQGLAWCAQCKSVKPISEMLARKADKFGVGSSCKSCENIKAEKRREAKRLKMQQDETFAENERAKERSYRKCKRQEVSDSIKQAIIEDPLSFKPAGLQVSGRESKALFEAGYKWCSSCKSVLKLEEFSNDSSSSDNKNHTCRKCVAQYRLDNIDDIKRKSKEYYQDNRDSIVEKRRQYVDDNYEKVKISKQKYYETYREEINIRNAEYRRKNKSKVSKQQADYCKRNKQHRAAVNKKWREKNREILAEKWRLRYQNDPEFKMKCICREMVRRMLKFANARKDAKTKEILGYAPEDLRQHIESQFKEGMTWDNYGEWHIDHIIPISSAKTLAEGIKLSQLDNLQPLWAEDNLKKSNKIIEENEENSTNL